VRRRRGSVHAAEPALHVLARRCCSHGAATRGVAAPCYVRPRQLPTAKFQLPTHSQFPTPKPASRVERFASRPARLGVRRWECLGDW
jgi:hypothetical protein